MKQNNFILAAGVSLAMAFTFSCSSDGSDGKDGAQGLQGETGANGAGCIVSSVDEGTKITCGTSTVIIPNVANGTNGTDGIDGSNGIDGTNGTNGADGIDGSNGIDGAGCEAEIDNNGGITITCGESTVGIAFCGIKEYSSYNPATQECQGGFVKYLNEALLKDTRDGKIYGYAEIGDYTWMAENLAYGTEDGRYNWEQALEACPSGWKLPTYDEVANTVDDYITEIEDIFVYPGSGTSWWTATENETDDTQVRRYGYYMSSYFSASIPFGNKTSDRSFVRCVKAN